MRCRFGGDGQAARLGAAHQIDGADRAGVGDVQAAAGAFEQRDVTRHHGFLGRRGHALEAEAERRRPLVHHALSRQPAIFLVGDDRQVEHGAVLERVAHQAAVHDRLAVVGDGDDAGLAHLADLGQALAGEPDGHGADRIDARQIGRDGFLDDVLGDRAGIVDGVGVGHARDGGEATGQRGARAGEDGLLVFVPRLAQVRVHVDQPGHHPAAAGIEMLVGVAALATGGDACDAPVRDQDVERPLAAAHRIDHGATTDEH
jgi:hypothetical protein